LNKKNFIHKIKIVLKKLRKTFVCLKIITRAKLFKTEEKINKALIENNELIYPIYDSVDLLPF